MKIEIHWIFFTIISIVLLYNIFKYHEPVGSYDFDDLCFCDGWFRFFYVRVVLHRDVDVVTDCQGFLRTELESLSYCHLKQAPGILYSARFSTSATLSNGVNSPFSSRYFATMSSFITCVIVLLFLISLRRFWRCEL